MRVRLGKLSRKTLLGLLPLTLILLLLPAGAQNCIRFAIGAPLLPLQRLVERALRTASQGLGFALFGGGDASAKRDLAMEVARLRAQVLKLEAELQATRRRLYAVAGARRQTAYKTIYAEVIGADPTSWRMTWLLDRGKSDGIRENMPVVWSDMAVGRICAAGRFQSSVALLSDPDSGIAVKSARSGAQGILEGRSGPLCRLKYLSYRQDLREGDLIVTSGADGIFPPEYVVGKCVRISSDTGGPFLSADVMLYFSPGRLEGVVVIDTGRVVDTSEGVSDDK